MFECLCIISKLSFAGILLLNLRRRTRHYIPHLVASLCLPLYTTISPSNTQDHCHIGIVCKVGKTKTTHLGIQRTLLIRFTMQTALANRPTHDPNSAPHKLFDELRAGKHICNDFRASHPHYSLYVLTFWEGGPSLRCDIARDIPRIIGNLEEDKRE